MKSAATVLVPGVALMANSVALADVLFSFAVTVTELFVPLSSMLLRDNTNCTTVPSLSRMVPVPDAVTSVALVGLLNVTLTVLVPSTALSSKILTSIVLVVSPAAKVRVPAVNAL